MSSSYATAFLYLNLGGEMLYILQLSSEVKKICPEMTAQVFNEMIFALLKPKQLQMIFQPGPLMSLSSLREIVQRVVLSTILKFDPVSMGHLFDVMVTMVKYQLATATGPREVILSTLNRIDAMRDMAVDKMLTKHIDNAHRRILDTYGKMTYKEVWQIRSDCLREIHDQNMGLLILLRLGVQNSDKSFNRMIQKYDEKYLDRREVLENIKLMDYEEEESMGCFSLFGDRVTLLGRNVYNLDVDREMQSSISVQNLEQVVAASNNHIRQEL